MTNTLTHQFSSIQLQNTFKEPSRVLSYTAYYALYIDFFFFYSVFCCMTGCSKVLQETSDLYQLSTVFMATPEHQKQNEEMKRYTDNILNFSLSFPKNQTT